MLLFHLFQSRTHATAAWFYLKSCRTICYNFCSRPKRSAGLVFSFSGNHFCTSISSGFSFRCHRSLKLFRYSNIFHLHTLHHYSPWLCAFIKSLLQRTLIDYLSLPQPAFISLAMASLLQRMSPRVIVPRTFRKVVAANSLADPP